jgi:hypothetical protein
MTAHRRRQHRGGIADPARPDPLSDREVDASGSGSPHQVSGVSQNREDRGDSVMERRAGLTVLALAAVLIAGSSAVVGAVWGHSRTQPGVGPQFVGSTPSHPASRKANSPQQAVFLPYIRGVIAIQGRSIHPVPNPAKAAEL